MSKTKPAAQKRPQRDPFAASKARRRKALNQRGKSPARWL